MAKRYWLMKTEPDTFGIDDLQRVNIEPWTGVRNYMARNFMRDQMQVGDDVIFYHSSADPSGAAGLARIERTGVVDETQFDPASKYHDPDSDRDDPRWICVDVVFVEKFPALVPLPMLRETSGLEDMVLLQRGSRLSVQPVAEAEYAIIARMGQDGVGASYVESVAKKPAAKKPATKAPAKKPATKAPAKKPVAKKPAAKKPAAKKPAAKTKISARASAAGARRGRR